MPYLNVDLDYFDHRKTKRLIGLLGRGAEILPLRLWAYCGKFHCEDGRLAGYSEQEIESIASWWGQGGLMLPAMEKAAWMGQDGTVWFMVAWEEHQGHLAAFREKGKAMAEIRWAKAREDARKYAASIAVSIAVEPPQQCLIRSDPIRSDPTEPTKPPDRNVVPQLQAEIGKHFNRKPEDRWGYDEEHALVEVCKRPGAEAEWLEIIAFRLLALRNGDRIRESVLSVLQNWSSELDRARNYKPPQSAVKAPRTVEASKLLDCAPADPTVSDETKASWEKMKAGLK